MRAVVLVGGVGTRLRPLTLTTPKQMLPVAGRPMIERVLAHLAAHGVDEATLSLGYRPDAFMTAYPDGWCAGVRLRYAVEPEPRGTAGGIAFAARQAGFDTAFLVHNGDVLTDSDIGRLIEFHRHRPAASTISLTPVDDPSRYGVVAVDDRGQVTDFVEKPPADRAPSHLVNAGTYVLEPGVVDRIAPDRPVSIEREIFPSLAAEGALYALASNAEWTDAGTPATYLSINLALARREQQWVHELAEVDPAAEVTGSVIAAGAVVGPRARVHGAVVMSGARVGAAASVRDSIVGTGAIVGDGAVVEALSVLGEGVVLTAGATACRARLPECGP